MVSALISRVVILVFGTLYPAYSSYKAVKNKDVKEYVKWMMYWIVFALFTTAETFADVLISWFPFYYELKIAFVVWLLSPATNGSSVLYKKFVHPELLKREQEIDQTLDKVKTQGYSALVNVGQQGLNFAVQKAITGQNTVMNHLMKKSFSMYDISQQPGDMRVTYQPSTDRITEHADEQDGFSDRLHPAPRSSLRDYNQLQTGEGSSDIWSSQFDANVNNPKSYNLRSREYHDDADLPDQSERSNYNHNEFTKLPKHEAITPTHSGAESNSCVTTNRIPKPPSQAKKRSKSLDKRKKVTNTSK